MSNSQDGVLIDIGPEHGNKEFFTVEEIRDWISTERAAFNWLLGRGGSDGHTTHNKINGWLSVAEDFIEKLRQYPDDKKHIENIIGQFQERFKDSRKVGATILSHSADAQFVFQLQNDQGPVVAASALACLLHLEVQSRDKGIEGVFWALQYKQGSTETVGAQKKSLEQLKITWNNHFKKQRTDFNKKNKELSDEIDGFKGEFSSIKDQINQLHETQTKQFGEILEESKKELANITNTYDNKMATKASVDYWIKKRGHHENLIYIFFFVTVIAGGITTFLFLNKANELLDGVTTHVSYLELSSLIAVSVLGIWVTRIFAKIFISNLHLRMDADERITMIQTYLALLREGNGPQEGDRQLILQTLFRPSSTGFVKEEGPVGLFELAKIFKKDSI